MAKKKSEAKPEAKSVVPAVKKRIPKNTGNLAQREKWFRQRAGK